MATELIVGGATHATLDVQPRAPIEWGKTEYIQVIAGDAPRYDGPYEVTPSAVAQTLDTSGMVMTDSVTVNPIPSNWGLVSWDGSVISIR